jgi:hypothetical protein
MKAINATRSGSVLAALAIIIAAPAGWSPTTASADLRVSAVTSLAGGDAATTTGPAQTQCAMCTLRFAARSDGQ